MQALQFKDIKYIANQIKGLLDNYIVHLTQETFQQLLWMIEHLLKSDFFGSNTDILISDVLRAILHQIDVNRTTRLSMKLAQHMIKFLTNNHNWLVSIYNSSGSGSGNGHLFVHQVIYLFMRLIENHEQKQLYACRTQEIQFVVKLFDQFVCYLFPFFCCIFLCVMIA